MLGVLQEGGDAVGAQIGAGRDRVGAEQFKRRRGVGARGVRDVATLGVEHDHRVRSELADQLDGPSQRIPAQLTGGLVERGLRLERADELARRLDHAAIEAEQLVSSRALGLRIEPDAEQRVGCVYRVSKPIRKPHNARLAREPACTLRSRHARHTARP